MNILSKDIMIKNDIGYAYNDLTIVPSVISDIKSRSEINCRCSNGRLPIFVAPMSSVINHRNYNVFESNSLFTVIPRSVDLKKRLELFGNDSTLFNDNDYRFIAMSLNEFKDYFCDDMKCDTHKNKRFNVCVDIANGHMKYLYELCKIAKLNATKIGYELYIMTGNIANPMTYYEISMDTVIDYIRVGIGGGQGCTTSSNVGIHYPMGSLINECNEIRMKYGLQNIGPKIIADGGIRNYSDVIKALALGADFVMIGGLFAGALESCGAKVFTNYKGEQEVRCANDAVDLYEQGAQLYTSFYGMASAEGQIAINHRKTKTAEGIKKLIPVTYKLHKWVENMDAYLRSAMSYCDSGNLDEFIGRQTLIVNSPAEIAAVNK